jgi:hypothetical protein
MVVLLEIGCEMEIKKPRQKTGAKRTLENLSAVHPDLK